MDAVERGGSFTVTRGGQEIGALVPLPRRRRYVSRADFAAMSRGAQVRDVGVIRADQAVTYDEELGHRDG